MTTGRYFFLAALLALATTGCTSIKPMDLTQGVPSDEAILLGSKVTHVNYGTSDYEFGRLYRGPFTIKRIAIVTCQWGDVNGPAKGPSVLANALLEGLATGLEKDGFEVILPETVSKSPAAKEFISNTGGAGHAKGSRDPNGVGANVVMVQHYDKSGTQLGRDINADVFLFVGATHGMTRTYAYVPYGRFKVACEAKDTSTTFFSFNHGREFVLEYVASKAFEGKEGAKLIGQVLARRFRLYYPAEQ